MEILKNIQLIQKGRRNRKKREARQKTNNKMTD